MHSHFHDTWEFERRKFLEFAAGATAAGAIVSPRARADAKPPPPTGKAGDFDFLSGEWKIHNRWFDGEKWLEFEGEATVTGILKGLASIEELRIPARQFSGMGLRLLDVERKLWADYWVPGDQGVMGSSPAWGSFSDGVGLWDADEESEGQPIIVRGAWDQITKTSCRWYQASSKDDGKTWTESWIMHWTRVKAPAQAAGK